MVHPTCRASLASGSMTTASDISGRPCHPMTQGKVERYQPARTARTEHRGVRRVLQQLSIPREPGQPDACSLLRTRSGHSQTEGKDQTKNHRTKAPPASAGNRSLNLQTRSARHSLKLPSQLSEML